MEQVYGVCFGQKNVGKVQVRKEGLYYRFRCRCRITGDVVCRLWVYCGENRHRLGVVTPMEGGFGLDTCLPVKKLGEGTLEFTLIPKHEGMGEVFVPIYPEEPFAYIAKLKDAFLDRRNGQLGAVIRQR